MQVVVSPKYVVPVEFYPEVVSVVSGGALVFVILGLTHDFFRAICC